MGPIPPVSLGASAGTPGLRRTNGAGATSGLNAADAPGRAAGANGPRPSSDLSELANLLQSLDGGKNSQLIRMLIGLMILLAILNQTDGGGSPTVDRAGGASGRGQELWMQTTSTSISIEQQSTTVFYASSPDAFDTGSAPEQQSLGEQLDLSA